MFVCIICLLNRLNLNHCVLFEKMNVGLKLNIECLHAIEDGQTEFLFVCLFVYFEKTDVSLKLDIESSLAVEVGHGEFFCLLVF